MANSIERTIEISAKDATMNPEAPVHPPDHCYVLLAGTINDLAAGKQDIIFSRLEKIVEDCCLSSALLVLSLPTRHDLPSDSPVHQTTALVNNYIAELCFRYEGAEMLDISNMDRSHLTPHGLHLRAKDRRYDASAPSSRHCSNCADLFDTLAKLGLRSHPGTGTARYPFGPPPPAQPRSPAAHTSPAPPESPVRTMAYDTFAEAVKSQRPANLHYSDNSGQKNCRLLKEG
ncbi:hypothetical protein J6590_032858 [Homalodisca vitripennis]|nr:hypothetical protein J6590_032858 [Homalodisca vitripennis]